MCCWKCTFQLLAFLVCRCCWGTYIVNVCVECLTPYAIHIGVCTHFNVCVFILRNNLKLCGWWLFHLFLSPNMIIQSRQTYNWLPFKSQPFPSPPHQLPHRSALMSGKSVKWEARSTQGPSDLPLTHTHTHTPLQTLLFLPTGRPNLWCCGWF